MDSKRVLALFAAAWVAFVASCDEDTNVAPPDPMPQIKTLASYKKTPDRRGLPSNNVFAFLAVSNGEFWIGTDAGIARYPSVTATAHSGPDDIVNEINGLPHPQVRAMAEDTLRQQVYVATWGGGIGVYDIATDSWTAIRQSTNGLRSNFVSDIAVSPGEARVYFATNNAVSIYNPAAGTFTSFTSGLLDDLVSSVTVINNAGVFERWYGPRLDEKVPLSQLSSHGITVSRGTTVSTYTTANSGLVFPNVNDIFYDSVRGVFWVAYVGYGISEVNVPAKTWTSHTLVEGLPSNTVYAIARADGRVWAATQGGLAEQRNGTWQGYDRRGGLPADRVRALYSDDGTRLWLGFVEGGAVRVDTDTD